MAAYDRITNDYGTYGAYHTPLDLKPDEYYEPEFILDNRISGTLDELAEEYLAGKWEYRDDYYALLHDIYESFSNFEPEELKNDVEIIRAAIKFNDDYSISELCPEALEDKDIVMALLDEVDARSNEHDKYNAFMELFNKGVGSDVLADKEVALRWVDYRADNLQDVSPELRDDKDVVLAAVKHDSQALNYASDRLKNDVEVVTAALRKDDCYAVLFAGYEVKNDKDFALKAIEVNPWNARFLSAELRNDKDIYDAVYKKDENLKEYITPLHNLYRISNPEDYNAFMKGEWKDQNLFWYSDFKAKEVPEYDNLKKECGIRGNANMYFRPYYNDLTGKNEVLIYTNEKDAIKDIKEDMEYHKNHDISCIVNKNEVVKAYQPKQIERLDDLALDYQVGQFDKHIGKISSFEDKAVTAIMKYGKDWHKHWKDMKPITEVIAERQAAKKTSLDDVIKGAKAKANTQPDNTSPDKNKTR